MPENVAARYFAQGWWDDTTLPTAFEDGLTRSAGQPVRFWSTQRPYQGTISQLADAARSLAAGLASAGIRPGDALAMQLPNWPEAAVTFWGAGLLGCVLVPVVHTYGPKELGFILERSNARALVTADRFGSMDYLEALSDHRRRCSALELVAVVGDDTGGGRSFPELVAGGRDPVGDITVHPDDPALLAFTSGTTAEPKGVVHSHRTLLAELRQAAAFRTPETSGARLIGAPVGHVAGMLGALLTPVVYEEPINLIDRWEPSRVLAALVEANLSTGGGATYFLTSLLDCPEFGPEHLAHMTRLTLGGAPIPDAVAERADTLGISLCRAYGSTEHPSTTMGQHEEPAEKRLHTDGRPMAGVEIRLDDIGQVWSRGPELCVGYTDPALTAEAFDADGWYATGDVGVIDADGYLTITDRVKDIIIRGGENISAAEVEGVMARLPGVGEVAVVAAPDSRFGEHACAFVRPAPGADPPGLEDVRAALAAAGLGRQKWPEELRMVDDFERTPSGKIKKHVLRALARG
ncbi:MAG TPA: AMP-binding protein [Acidimicrobiales bacterium]|nr:AMP-binding protein [Acidimicrobiales bacterium]